MNIRRYFGRTNREALAALRRELGPEAVVLRNQAVEGGVELLAMSADALPGAVSGAPPNATPSAAVSTPVEPQVSVGPTPAMSTLSFQQYVRDRLARRGSMQPVSAQGPPAQPLPVYVTPAPAAPRQAAPTQEAAPMQAAPTQAAPAHALPEQSVPARTAASVPVPEGAPAKAIPAAAVPGRDERAVLAELRDLRRFVSDQLGALAWFERARRNAPQARLVAWLLAAGLSPALVRLMLSRIQPEWSAAQTENWIRRALAHNMNCDPSASPLETGGVYALVGPTGVGKTTTTAKLAARFALLHGVGSVGLITVDAYRIGGKDQLRSFGRMLGVPVHVAHDSATLSELLDLFGNRKLVLIDTAGLGQRDQRVETLLRALEVPRIRRLVVLNATAQVETLDDVACAYRAHAAAGVVLTKVDEAARLGGVLDCVLRHRLRVVGIADGQRVPEDWKAPDAAALVGRALSTPADAASDLQIQQFEVLMTGAAVAGGVHV